MNRLKILLVLLFSVGSVLAEEPASGTNEVAVVDSLKATNDVEVAEAVEAMKVEEKSSEAAEAVEVAATVQHAKEQKAKEKKEAAKSPEKIDPWEAFSPPVDSEFDWLQLTSGEWLKGDFKVMYDFTLEFDSDELNLQEFDFDDVAQLRTRAMKTIFVEGEGGHRDTSVLRGLLVIKDNQVKLLRSEHEVSIPRERVISIAGGKGHERDYWSGMASVGVNARSGNTETVDATVIANIKRRTARTRFNADYLANYSETGQQGETADNQRVSGYFDWFFTSRFYWKALEAEYYRDPFSNIGGQYSASSGVGYDLMHTPRTDWTINMGLGYQELRYESVQVGDPASSGSPFFTAGTRLDYELTGDIDIIYDYSMRRLNTANGKYTHHMLGTLSFDLIGNLDLDVSVIWDHISSPTPIEDAGLITVPEQDDYQLIVSLAYDF